jgi:4-oxalocrotonate tautomerase
MGTASPFAARLTATSAGAAAAAHHVAGLDKTKGVSPTMPVVIVKLYEGRTIEQKRAAAKAITEVVVETLKTSAEATHIIFEDVKKSDWANAGKLASD